MDIHRLRRALASVASSEQLRLAVLFGSAARGEGRAEDLDIALRGKAPWI